MSEDKIVASESGDRPVGFLSGLLQQAALVFISLLFLTPLVWMVLTSLKPETQLVSNPHAVLPETWEFDNYRQAVESMPYLRYLRNSLLLCFGSVLGTLISCSLAAYAFARLEWRGRSAMFALLIATMLLPWQVTMIPRFLLIRELGLYNTLAALIVPTFFGTPFYIFLLRQFFQAIPSELADAARLDGCSEFGIFWRIVVPLSRPALATVALFQFIAAWNDFNGPLLYLSDPDQFPLAYGLERFVSSYSSQTNLLMAAAVLFTLPIVILFFFTQRTFLRGIATTGLKS
jgi:multiple sugar transport system permease protein